MTEQLKPCPFCGNVRNIGMRNEKHNHSGGYFISCPECDASTGLRYAMGDDPRPLLIEAWNRRAQPAQAVPVLTESELRSILQGTNHMVKNAMHGAFWPELEEACRAIEQAVRAKLGVAVPMTDEQWQRIADITGAIITRPMKDQVEAVIGIVGKEGE